jgi:hypothetical protein
MRSRKMDEIMLKRQDFIFTTHFHNLLWRFCPFSGKMAEISEKDEKTRSSPFWEISFSRM